MVDAWWMVVPLRDETDLLWKTKADRVQLPTYLGFEVGFGTVSRELSMDNEGDSDQYQWIELITKSRYPTSFIFRRRINLYEIYIPPPPHSGRI